jgi:putative addiction module component (TIGR02574 family)
MARDVEALFQEASELPEHERATLAGLLINSLGPEPEEDVEAAWTQEIQRRIAELEAGTVETVPWEDVRRELFARIRGR